ncbi:glycoside hydrolase family 5 protein [Hyaloscypha variabilis F]|uniref:Glycoside hydrolase family 5 protein n=1 Tax=Hyaloscypha variabilis (strain UAMH 11265 / GT02V1 / F) TaxID=1149755 RepID=A0A2J6RCX5_HYAVF|nr:glycoside hydrolase family 5 protein [Hyaloscypha variabilis F]
MSTEESCGFVHRAGVWLLIFGSVLAPNASKAQHCLQTSNYFSTCFQSSNFTQTKKFLVYKCFPAVGVNSLDIGEGFGHDGWFFNATNFNYSLQAVDGVLSFIKNSGHIGSFTSAPSNEASDNFAGFGSAAGLTTNGTDWINTYIKACLAKIAQIDKRIPLMRQDFFKGEEYCHHSTTPRRT